MEDPGGMTTFCSSGYTSGDTFWEVINQQFFPFSKTGTPLIGPPSRPITLFLTKMAEMAKIHKNNTISGPKRVQKGSILEVKRQEAPTENGGSEIY